MQFWFSDQARLSSLIVLCALLWTLESFVPLYGYGRDRLPHAFPNVALAVLLILMNLALSAGAARLAAAASRYGVGLFFLVELPAALKLILGVAALDFFAYLAHLLLHKSWLGWQFHRVHHSEKVVDVTTAFRQHPGETVWRVLWQLGAVAVFGLPLWVVVVYLTLSALNAQLEHANVHLGERADRVLRLLVVTPNMHKAHHSRRQVETDTNYSNIFSLWDRLCGTYTPRVNFDELRYGLDGFDGPERQTLRSLLKLPFVKVEAK
ncbi:MAG TPA: sterol desaturase family protein [Pyrinomonadaceae bacterium]|nr:sterol desaturase family protein [Pyrinomonadaceae bacterium]